MESNYPCVEAYDESLDDLTDFEVIDIREAKRGEMVLDVREMSVTYAGNDHGFKSVIVRPLASAKKGGARCGGLFTSRGSARTTRRRGIWFSLSRQSSGRSTLTLRHRRPTRRLPGASRPRGTA